MQWDKTPRCHLAESRSRRRSEPAVTLRRSILQICTAFSFSLNKGWGKTACSRWVDARGSCSSCCKGVARAELLSPSFPCFLSPFLQTRTNLPPVLLRVAMAIGEVLHGPSANCSSPAQANGLAESKRSELALGLTRDEIHTAALGIYPTWCSPC